MQKMEKEDALQMMEEMEMNEQQMEKNLEQLEELFKQLEMEYEMQQQIDKLNKLAEEQEKLAEETEKADLRRATFGGDPQGVRDGTGRDQPDHAGDRRGLCGSHRFEQYQNR